MPENELKISYWRAPSCQPYGAAFFIDKNGTILTLTESTSELLAAPEPSLLLGQNLESVSPPLFEVWLDRVNGNMDPRDWTRVSWNGSDFDARAVPYKEYWLIDVWPGGETINGWNDVQQVATIVRTWLQNANFNLQSSLEQYRQWLDFDMALVYQLEETGEGEIIAESKNNDVISLLGLHYPVAQIGHFAQALGYQNIARNIVDIQAKNIRWLTIEPHIDPVATDLSVCRELDEHHSYLINTLGFRSTLMLPIIMDGNVKGLLMAYSKKPRILSGVNLLVARNFAQSLSLKINADTLKQKFEYQYNLHSAFEQLEHVMYGRQYNADYIFQHHSELLLKLVNGEKVYKYDYATEQIDFSGPNNIDYSILKKLFDWLSNRIPFTIDAYSTGIFVSDYLEGSYANFDEHLMDIAGIMAIRLPNKDILLFTRKSSLRSIDTSRRSPWRYAQIHRLKGHSKPWSMEEQHNASLFLRFMCQIFQSTTQASIITPELHYDAVIVFALDGRILYLNQKARLLTNNTSQFENGQHIKIFDLLGGDSYLNKKDIQEAMSIAYHDIYWTGEWVIRKHGCHECIISILNATLKRKHLADAEVYFTLTAKDITDYMNAKEEQEFISANVVEQSILSSELFRSKLHDIIEEKKVIQNLKSGLLLLIDLDGSKNFIKAIGQKATEEVTRLFSQRLLYMMGTEINVCHLGGDEFGIIVPNIDNDAQAWIIAKMLIHQITRPFAIDNFEDPIKLTGCIGMALFPMHGNNVNDLLNAADNAMYAAKRSGKGQIKMHHSDSSVNVSQKFHQAGELRRAIQNNELRAYFQPQFNAITRKIIGAEALVRWEHPEKGLLPPSMFIHVAEDYGLIDKLGEWVLHDTLRQLGTWPTYQKNNIVVSVNASVRQLRDQEHFLYVIDNALKEYNVGPSSLEIEITETIWMGENDDALNTLKELQKRGIKVAIDDFGTGYSNIAYLQKLPIDKIKFDRSFVVAGEESDGGRKILKGMVSLAKSLNIDVLAEGVETEEQEKMLLEVGIENMQGFAYARPMTEQHFLELLLNQDNE